jgi:hypothetical protein
VRLCREVVSSGTRWLSCKQAVLVTLRGCHLLDAWWWSLSKPVRSLCGALEKSFVRGIVLTPREQRRATLVERVIEIPSLSGYVLAMPDVRAWQVMPVSRRTTK